MKVSKRHIATNGCSVARCGAAVSGTNCLWHAHARSSAPLALAKDHHSAAGYPAALHPAIPHALFAGMPEVGNMPLPKKLLKQGVTDMVRVSDARMSGTACEYSP